MSDVEDRLSTKELLDSAGNISCEADFRVRDTLYSIMRAVIMSDHPEYAYHDPNSPRYLSKNEIESLITTLAVHFAKTNYALERALDTLNDPENREHFLESIGKKSKFVDYFWLSTKVLLNDALGIDKTGKIREEIISVTDSFLEQNGTDRQVPERERLLATDFELPSFLSEPQTRGLIVFFAGLYEKAFTENFSLKQHSKRRDEQILKLKHKIEEIEKVINDLLKK
ncbi:hypothetical protein FACS1894172_17630 [Spirochaetia bacterium]|nr:hypothetical protein FACS1894164_11290 [Spirochaetia bacterium]GHU35611.1 hypothetical protein FACS1894172_17630 [Spirochaetia bacterium]